jgi:hypothetical protein
VIQDRVAEAGENLEVQADLPAEAERVPTIHEAANLLAEPTGNHFHAHAVIVTTQSQDVPQNSQEKETIKKIFQNHAEVKRLVDQKIKAPDFLLVAISRSIAHAMIVMIQSQDALRQEKETTKKIFQNQGEVSHSADQKISHLDFLLVVINRIQNRAMTVMTQNQDGHVMIRTIQNQDVLRNFPDQLIMQNPEAKDAILAHAMIAMNQNHGMTNSIVLKSQQIKRDSFQS